ncbi:hypothetical protein AEAC466_07660 [Asticcacaulis sp. AC466]|nr:hypothetical protein AEAC466_07660 [Asticcacaulis sp. AC466]
MVKCENFCPGFNGNHRLGRVLYLANRRLKPIMMQN